MKILPRCLLLAALVGCGSQKESGSQPQASDVPQPTESEILTKIAGACTTDRPLCTESLISYFQDHPYQRAKLVAQEIPEAVIREVEAALMQLASSSDCLRPILYLSSSEPIPVQPPQYRRTSCR